MQLFFILAIEVVTFRLHGWLFNLFEGMKPEGKQLLIDHVNVVQIFQN